MIKLNPFIQSDDSLCGPACLKMVLDYYGVQVSEEELAKEMNHTYEYGCTNEDIVNTARNYGFICSSSVYTGFKDIEWAIENNIPVIVDWFSGDIPDGHSSIIIGIDDENIYLQDPLYEEPRTIKKEDFYRVWFDFKDTPIRPDNLVIRFAAVVIPYNSLLII